jgi:predicted metalloprotease with PDZ domain
MASSRRRLSIATLLQVLSVSFSALAPGQPRVLYTLAMSKPSTHLFEVSMKVESLPPQQTLDFLLPVWRPGMYRVLDLAGGIQEFAAYDGDDRPLRWQKIDKSDWRVEANGTSVVIIRYKVYANEFYQRTRGLNDEHGFVDGTAVFMYLESCRNTPLMLEVQPFHGWHVTTGLDGAGNRFHAPSYDYFVDCPLEVGTQRDFEFTVDRVPHVLSISSEGNWTADTLIRDISKIVKAQKDFWGEFPYKRYVFLVECLPNPTGATEHMNSTIIHTSPFIFKNPDWYRNFLGNVSHEYFHTWNVKQLRPKGMDPYKFQSENYSNELWVAEGTTSYYGNLFMERLGFVKPDKFVSDIAGAVQTDRQQPGNSVQPPSDASFDSWVKGSRGQESAYNFESDIYQRGANVSGILDLQIRKMSGNKHSLDDVMKEMYKRFPLTGSGYTLKACSRSPRSSRGRASRHFLMHTCGERGPCRGKNPC